MVRKARAEDAPRIAEMTVFGKRTAYRSIFQNDRVSFHEIRVVPLYERYQNDPDLLNGMLVYDDGIVKGVIDRVDHGDSVELCNFYVEPFFKGNGIGRELIQTLIAQAREAGKKCVFLWVIKENHPARRFYEANGFVSDGREQPIEGTDKLDVYYELAL